MKLKILLISIGSRGDIEPFLAIAELLKKEGHIIHCAFPEQFRASTEQMGIDFFGLDPSFLELLHSKDGQVVMGGGKNILDKVLSFVRLASKGMKINKVMMAEQQFITEEFQPDLILHHTKAVFPLYQAVNRGTPQKIISPVLYIVHPIKGYSHLGFPTKILGINIQNLSYKIANYSLLNFVISWSKKLPKNKTVSRKSLKKSLNQTPLIYTISPSLFLGTITNNNLVKVLGHHEKSARKDIIPNLKLTEFIERHPKILLITFGSMTNPWAEKITRLFCEILEEQKIPTIINTANGGLITLKDSTSDLIHFEENLDYHWILPKIYAFIHHGGSGTTHLGIKYGCATMIIPHIVDQFIWNKLIAEKGVGPKGLKINKLNYKRLKPKIIDLWNTQSFKKQATQLSAQIRKEDFKKEFIDSILE